jgi:histone acetyltransferase (RNA polymerase elongator complex component)
MILPVFLPHLGCGRRCTYCNQNLISDSTSAYQLEERLHRLFAPLNLPVEVALYGGNPLGLGLASLKHLFARFEPYRDKIARFRLSARPEPVSRSVIDVLKDQGVRTIEFGTPTFNDRILARLSRGHSSEDSRNSVRLMKEEGFETGMQVMVGLPGETADDLRETVSAITSLAPSFLRIYPLVVIEGTPLFEQFSSGDFIPDTIEAAVAKAAFIYASAWEQGIVTIKMGLTENPSLKARVAAGPYHPAFGYMVKSDAFRTAVMNRCERLNLAGQLLLRICPSDVPHLVGYKRLNIRMLNTETRSIAWDTDELLRPGHFIVEAKGMSSDGNLTDALPRTLS